MSEKYPWLTLVNKKPIKQVPITLSDNQVVNAYEIKQTFVVKGEGCNAKWWVIIKLYDYRETYTVCHNTREDAMKDADNINEAILSLGIIKGVRDWMYDWE